MTELLSLRWQSFPITSAGGAKGSVQRGLEIGLGAGRLVLLIESTEEELRVMCHHSHLVI